MKGHATLCDTQRKSGQNCNCAFGDTMTRHNIEERIKGLKLELWHYENLLSSIDK